MQQQQQQQHRWVSSIFTCLLMCVQVAKDLGDKVQVLKVDVDENPALSTQLQVCAGWTTAMPACSCSALNMLNACQMQFVSSMCSMQHACVPTRHTQLPDGQRSVLWIMSKPVTLSTLPDYSLSLTTS